MARRIKTKASTGANAVKRRRSWRTTRTLVDTTALIEIGPDDPRWADAPTDVIDAKGAIVKLVPPAGQSEAYVTAMERLYYRSGAASVKTMPVQEEVKVTVEGETFDFSDAEDERSLRQVVMDRADRTTNAHDPDALKRLLTLAMDQAEATA